MDIFILFLIGFFSLLLAHSYLFYPLLLGWLSRGKLDLSQFLPPFEDSELPFVSVLIAAYNEEKVIVQKMEALLQTNYPYNKIRFFIGSDGSSDQTNQLIASYQHKIRQLHFFPFSQRRGKPSVINELAAAALETAQRWNIPAHKHIFILNDANVIPQPKAFYELAKHFLRPQIGLVDSIIVPFPSQATDKEGISQAEQTYLSGEAKLKHREGQLWGLMLGPMGGCYALRANLYQPIPPQVLVDDFYIAMAAFAQPIAAINEPKAVCYEKNPSGMSHEFRRKSRIAAGNFYNLVAFRRFLWYAPRPMLSFVWISHKVLRWLGGFFILINYLLVAILYGCFDNLFYLYLFITANLGLLLPPALDWLLSKMGLHLKPVRFLSYFILMNLAFLVGFYRYLKGGNQGIWTPTQR